MSDDEYSDNELSQSSNTSNESIISTNWMLQSSGAPEIQPYHGELTPRGFLHGAFNFAAMLATNYKGAESVQHVMSLMAPKLIEFAGCRKFRMEMLLNGLGGKLGNGRFSDVWRATLTGGIREIAVKQFKDLTNPLVIYKEVHTLIAAQHKRVVQLLGAFHESGMGTYIVMQLCLGNLRQSIGILTPLQMVRFCIQLLEALCYIHSMNIIHCDVRPDNCLITKENNIVLADFGDAQLLPKNTEYIRLGEQCPFLGCKGYCDDGANDGVYSKSTDIFGFACTLFEMETGRPLMEYRNWPDVSRFEYQKVVWEGRLLYHQPVTSSKSDYSWNMGGERETLIHRSTSAPLFWSVLKDLVYKAFRRLGASELLERHKDFFNHHLAIGCMSMDQIDNDVEIGDVRLLVDNNAKMRDYTCTKEMDTVMDLIYYDFELTITEPRIENVTEHLKEEFDTIQIENQKRFGKTSIEQIITTQTTNRELYLMDIRRVDFGVWLKTKKEAEDEKKLPKKLAPCFFKASEDSDSEPESEQIVRDRKKEKQKWWYIQNRQAVPLELRGVAPPPTNLPFGFQAEEDWSGWFDCRFCNRYYTYDYAKVFEHVSQCNGKYGLNLMG